MRRFKVLVGGTLLGAMVCLAALGTPQGADAISPKWIILWPRDFEPEGLVNPGGQRVWLQFAAEPPREATMAESVEYLIIAFQEDTGAVAMGTAEIRPTTDKTPKPLAQQLIVSPHVDPESPPFRPGPVSIYAAAIARNGEEVVRTWEWTSEVELRRK